MPVLGTWATPFTCSVPRGAAVGAGGLAGLAGLEDHRVQAHPEVVLLVREASPEGRARARAMGDGQDIQLAAAATRHRYRRQPATGVVQDLRGVPVRPGNGDPQAAVPI